MNGTITIKDEEQLELKLKEAGLWLTEAVLHAPGAGAVARSRGDPTSYRLRGKQGRRELIEFCTLMTFQIRSGITLVRALDVAAQDCKNLRFKSVLEGLQQQIESGLQIHEAMAKYPGVFSSHFVSVIRAGELTSNLAEGFDDLRAYTEWTDGIISQVRQASLYPTIVLGVISVFTIFLFSFIIPKFAALLDSLHVPQPLLTRVIFAIGGVVQGTWWLWVPAIFLLAVGVPFARRFSPGFALSYDRLKLRWPIFGELNLMLALSRFTHNFAILYRSGLPIIQALKACQHGLIGNAAVELAVAHIEQDVENGSTISESMHRHPEFSALLVRMVGMGETSGNLDAALDNVADYYNQVIPRRIKTVFAILEPMLMLFLIVLVGCVALAIYLPLISLMGAIR